MKHVVVYKSLQQKQLEFMKRYFKVSYYPEVAIDNKEFLESLSTADGLFGAGMKITEELLDRAEKLKVISNFSAGYDNLDLDMLTNKGIIATNAPDALVDTVADLIFGLVLTSARRISELDHLIRKNEWKEEIGEEHFGTDVHHKNIGIVGFGHIGQKVAQRANGFDMNVLYHQRSRDVTAEKEYKAEFCEDLSELLNKSDFVCLTLPLTESTKHLISEKELKLMKPSAILINGSRGPIVDETALIKSLKEGEISSAGLDVFEKEPLEFSSELLTLKNVVLTPHIGSATFKTRESMQKLGIKNLIDALNNETPDNILNKEVL